MHDDALTYLSIFSMFFRFTPIRLTRISDIKISDIRYLKGGAQMSISRIPPSARVQRDAPSSGHEQVDKALKPETRNPQVDQVSKLYEKQFLQEMFKAMRATVKPTDEPSMAQHIYQDQLDDQYVDAWGESGGIGLSDMIYNQIMEKFYGKSTAQEMKKQGPVELTNRDISRISKMNKPGQSETRGEQIPLRVEVKPSPGGGAAKIQAPWDAEVTQTMKLADGKTAVMLSHGEGLRSTLVFDGVPSAEAQPGKKLLKGQTLGVLSPEAKSFLWNLGHRPASPGNPGTSAATKAPETVEKVGTGPSQYDTL
jgi:flagellar protein FlgJ